jgi:hypothetical protein
MKRLDPEIIDYYNNEVVQMISDKYGYNHNGASCKKEKNLFI